MSSEPPRRPLSTGAKIAIGCGALLVLAGVVGVALFCGGTYWLVSPGRQVPTAVVIGPESAGVLRCDDLAQDTGARALVVKLFDEMQKTTEGDDAALPPFVRTMRRWQRANAGQSLMQWMPREATLSFEPDAQHGLVPVTAVNFRIYVRPIRAFLERVMSDDRNVQKTRYKDRTILTFANGTSVCFLDGTVVFGRRPPQLQAVLDRAERLGDTPPPLPASMTTLPGQWDVRATMDRPEKATPFASGVLAAGGVAPDAAAAREVTALRYGIDAETAERARVLLELTYPDDERAAAAAAQWTEALDGIAEKTRAWGLGWQGAPRVDGTRVVLDLQMDGVGTAAGRWLATTAEKGKQDRKEAEEPAEDAEEDAGDVPGQ